ncbi:unnamed protein product [Pleuronectes platessa]|uniref:Uncharacterized protein n=1 Tax=Pleuronectes platessa TaxID=8262 RepID=A0A9N7Y880_PLEPL|nr:unnamed protein product [Pleuronectes platessa]
MLAQQRQDISETPRPITSDLTRATRLELEYIQKIQPATIQGLKKKNRKKKKNWKMKKKYRKRKRKKKYRKRSRNKTGRRTRGGKERTTCEGGSNTQLSVVCGTRG